jgi:lysophospholipase L1-like esterase
MSAMDFGARGLVAQLNQRVAADGRRARLRRLMTAARGANASDLPVLAAPPSFSCSGNAASAGLSQVVTASAAPSLFALYGGIPARDGSGNLYGGGYWRAQSVTLPSGGNAGVATGAQGVAMRVAFRTDALAIDVVMLGQASASRVRLLVDGQYADKTGAACFSSSGGNTFNIVWPNGTSRRMRRYDIEFEKDGGFFGVRIGAGDALQPVAIGDRYRIGVIGDSVAASTGATRSGDGWAFHAGRRLGNMDLDLVSMSIGSTGYIAPGTTWPFASHLADLTLQPLDEIWLAGGANDQGYATADVTAAVLGLLAGVRLRCPAQPVIVMGSFIGGGQNAQALATETAIKAAFDQWRDPNSAFVPFNLASPRLQTGNSAAPATGNYQYYGQGSIDTTHPSDAGHDYIGSYVAEARRQIIL